MERIKLYFKEREEKQKEKYSHFIKKEKDNEFIQDLEIATHRNYCRKELLKLVCLNF